MFAVIQFPGSNDDYDAYYALKVVLGVDVCLVWHKKSELPEGTRAVLLPGGFSYGDYLRAGAMAQFSPIMFAVRGFAKSGGIVLGICNGFQMLCEMGLLPGVLRRNSNLLFVCDTVNLRIERDDTLFSSRSRRGEVLSIPIKHGEGSYFAYPDDLKRLERGGQVLMRYCDSEGDVSASSNPNGSLSNIAAVTNGRGNVCGLMPHPEHAVEPHIGGSDGVKILGSLIDYLRAGT